MNEVAIVFSWRLCFLRKRFVQRYCSRSIDASHCHFLNTALQKSRRKLFFCSWQKIIGLSENSGWKGLQEVSALQSPVKIRVNYGIRPSSLGLYPVRSWRSPRVRIPYLSVQPLPLLDCSHGEKAFPPF